MVEKKGFLVILTESMQGTSEQMPERGRHLTEAQRRSLHHIEAQLQSEKHHDGTDKWWRFFDAGVRDEHGAVWALYNDFHHQEAPEGWKMFYCPPHEEEFQNIEIDRALYTVIPGNTRHEDTHTMQLDVGGEANRPMGMVHNDILNILFRGEKPPIVRFWSDKTAMIPVAIEQTGEEGYSRPIIEMGARALEVERPAA
ncbi:MAG TPA: hypothetical protein PKD28_01285 [Candidatus Saccharibacteria bacterium]|nr:hypothetical protein [Candidatus Saccharibacteria bacterium]